MRVKKRLAGDTERSATSNEVKDLRSESSQLKEALAEQLLENRLLKKSMIGVGDDDALDTQPQRKPRSLIWLNTLTFRCAETFCI